MKVAEIMTRDVKTCSPNDSLHTAAKLMWDGDCGCVPVVDTGSRPVGMLTDRDICMAAYTQGTSLHVLKVAGTMASTVISCNPEDDVPEADQLMRRNKVRRLPVVGEDGKLAGIVSLSDIAQAAERQRREGRKREIKAAELTETLAAISEPRGHTEAHVAFGPEEGELEFRPPRPPKRGHLRKPHDRIR